MTRERKNRLKHFLFFAIGTGFFGAGILLLWAATLPIPDLKTFDERVVAESTKIYDRTGEVLLYDFHENIQRTVVPVEDISHHIKNATVAIEDDSFYDHRGVRPLAFFRAILVNALNFGFSQGGSTLTQQVVKNSLLTTEKKISRKLKEWVLSVKLENVLNKDEILGLYLNEAPYGGNIYGIEDASRIFFGKSAKETTLAEAAYLASLPQAPTYYSPYGNHIDELERRKNFVLTRMRALEFITEEEYQTALAERVEFKPKATYGIRAPHFVFFIREYLEQKYGRDAVERGGLKVLTTLNAELQEKAELIVTEYAETNAKNFNAHNASLTAIDPKTGEILVMVGSRDYFGKSYPENCRSGIDCAFDPQVNVATVKPGRQPGSAFKPFVYATAFAKGYTPETVVFDLETQFHAGCDTEGKPVAPGVKEEDCYKPSNYDSIFRGPVSLRDALAQSINIPAIKVLYLAGLKDSLETAKRMGITSLSDINRYGLTLVLGGGEVSLLELTSAYGVFANEGVRMAPVGILSIADKAGNELESYVPKKETILEPNVALQISDILSDNKARTPAFGEDSYLKISGHTVAAKTGTTNDYRDAWIVGYTPTIVVGAWAGNNDNREMEKRVAGFIIAPLWNAFMKEALKTVPEEPFKKPLEKDLETLKPILRGVWLGGETYAVDSISGKLATAYTPQETKIEEAIPDVHSILYWLKRDNPAGERPEQPEEDPQFLLWETPVRTWANEHNFETKKEIPTAQDDVHKPEFAPKISITGINPKTTYHPQEKITLTVTASGKFPATRVDFFLNGVYIGKTQRAPFIFSFVPSELANIKHANELQAVVYDAVLNRSEQTVSFSVSL